MNTREELFFKQLKHDLEMVVWWRTNLKVDNIPNVLHSMRMLQSSLEYLVSSYEAYKR